LSFVADTDNRLCCCWGSEVTVADTDNRLCCCFSTMDPNTAHPYLRLSNGNKTATYGSWNSYPQHPNRFQERLQVMCREGLNGRHYWEMDWSDSSSDYVGVGVAYRSVCRSDGSLGYDPKSWYFGHKCGWYSCIHIVSYNVSVPSDDISRIGVFLDRPAGTLSFYRVSSNTLTHLYTFNDTFTEPLFTAFWVATDSSYITLHGF
uniref:B30.2/SPRY domain-containing protein n=1 Tax=Sphaeramia orbicularis TaxID=375764 RepID=A0A673AAD4_9TELE